MSPRDMLLALVVVAVWGCNFVFIKFGVAEVPPLLLTSLRYVAAILPAIFFIRRPQVALSILVAYGLAVGVGQFGLLYLALKFGMPAGLGSLVLQLQAFFTFGLAALFLGERLRGTQLLGASIALVGIGAIATERLGGAAIWPFLMTVVAGFFWGVSNILNKRAGKIDMLAFVVWSSLVPPIPLFLLSLAIEGPGAVPLALSQITWLGIISILFMGWVSTAFAYGGWAKLMGKYPTTIVAPFSLLVPVFGIAATALVLGERITGLDAIGCALVFAGLMVNVFGPQLRRVRAST